MPRADGTPSRSGKSAGTTAQRMGPGWQRICAEVYRTKGTRCHWCGCETYPMRQHRPQPNSRTVDHLLARSLGGSNHLENLVPSCWRDNTSRGNGRARTQRPPRPDWRITGSL